MSEEQNNSSEQDSSGEHTKFDLQKYFGLERGDAREVRMQKIESTIGMTMLDLQAKVGEACRDRAEELSLELTSIAQHGDYDKMIEDRPEMIKFLKTDCFKSEAWDFSGVSGEGQLLKFEFRCVAIDGDKYFDEENPQFNETLFGVVIFGMKTKEIRHCFVSVNSN
jgi:hypothetical protein